MTSIRRPLILNISTQAFFINCNGNLHGLKDFKLSYKKNITFLNRFFEKKINLENSLNIQDELDNLNHMLRYFEILGQLSGDTRNYQIIKAVMQNLQTAQLDLQTQKFQQFQQLQYADNLTQNVVNLALDDDETPALSPSHSQTANLPTHSTPAVVHPHIAKAVPLFNPHQKMSQVPAPYFYRGMQTYSPALFQHPGIIQATFHPIPPDVSFHKSPYNIHAKKTRSYFLANTGTRNFNPHERQKPRAFVPATSDSAPRNGK